MSEVPGKLTLDKDGKLHGNPLIAYNNPWPLKFARGGVTGAMHGVLLHTMVGSLESCIATFNAPNAAGSAHIGIGQDGRIHQFVPIGKGFETYHAFAANMAWYGVETEDFGKPHTPITDAGLWAWAQVFEFLSGYAGFPCEITDSCDGKGLAYHRMCKEWNLSAHSCPGATMTDMVRVNQRAEIVKRAKLIRAGSSSTPPPPDVPLRHVTIRGDGSLRALATKSSLHAEDILWQTSAHQPAGYGSLQLRYFRAGNWDAVMPTGMILWLGKAGLQDAPPPATAQVSWMTKLLKRRYGK